MYPVAAIGWLLIPRFGPGTVGRLDSRPGGLSIDEQNQRQTDLYLSEYQREQRYIDNIIKQDAETKRFFEELFK